MTEPEFPFDKARPLEVNKARLEHLVSLGLDLENKSVLEVGAGIGLLTHFFEERGCSIISTDGRPGNIAENIRRHPWRVGELFFADLREPDNHRFFGPFDIVFAYGILYMIPAERLAPVIEELASLTKELLLATIIARPKDDGQLSETLEHISPIMGLDERNCRPARDWFMNELRKHFEFVYLTKTQPNDRVFKTHWPAKAHDCRAVFVASRKELHLDTLTEELLTEQEHYEGNSL